MGNSSEVERTTWSPDRWERNVLLLAPSSRELELDCCVDLLTPEDPRELNVWCLGITLSPDEWMRAWTNRCDEYPEEFRVVSAQHHPRDAMGAWARELGFDPVPSLVNLEDPKNLTRIGVELIDSLQAWEDNGNETVVCFHSLTSLLQHVSTEQAYQFLHPFTNAVRKFDAHAHYHINPRAHDEQDIERLTTLFDGVWDPNSE